MRRKWTGIIILLLIAAGAAAVAGWFYYTKEERARAAAVAQMPEFRAFTASGQEITNKDVEGEKGILLFISPGCHFCRGEVQEIRDNIALFKGHPVYIIGGNESVHQGFTEEFKLANVKGLQVLNAAPGTFKNFQIQAVPQAMVYDKKGRLIERVEGYRPVEELAELL